MKKIAILILLLGLAFAGGHYLSQVSATGNYGVCISTGPQCGTDNGTKLVCPEGTTYHDGKCRKPVYKYSCDFNVDIHGDDHHVGLLYNKPTGDDNHCHRIVWHDLSDYAEGKFKEWHWYNYNFGSPDHGSWASAYNHHIDENPVALQVFDHYDYVDKTVVSCHTGVIQYDSLKSLKNILPV